MSSAGEPVALAHDLAVSRRGLAGEAAEALEEERRWAAEAFAGAQVERVDSAGPYVAVAALLGSLPRDPQVLLGWIAAARGRLSGSAVREEVAEGGGSA